MVSIRRIFGKQIPIPIPPELASEDALLAHIGVSAAELKKIWWFRHRMYSQFSISKRSGKVRTITAPDRRLKIIQRKLTPLLDGLYRLRHPVHGFVPGRSVKSNAEAHGRRRFVINIDLQDFFPTITEKRVYGLLRALAVDQRVSEIVARLCCYKGHLPQGAPTSPVLSNMICYRLDTELLQIAKSVRAIYTRYADDITFSSYQPPSLLFDTAVPAVGKFPPSVLAPQLREVFINNGFEVNPDKAHYADRNSRRMVTGVKINAGLNVDRRYVRHIRAILHSVEKLGLPNAQSRYAASGGKGNIAEHLRGKISYITHLKGNTDPVVRSLALRFNKNFIERPITLTPTLQERRERAVWVIEHDGDNGTQGTAFFLKEVGLVTACHCVEKVSEIRIYNPSKPTPPYKGIVVKRSAERDLALINHNIPITDYYDLEAVTLSTAVGNEVTALGYPDINHGDQLNVRSGSVTSLPMRDTYQMIEVSQELAQGMSGGPIVNSHDQVLGVIHKGGPHEARQIAISIDVLQKWSVE